MKVAQIMDKNPVMIDAKSTFCQLAEHFYIHKVSDIFIIDEHKALIGVASQGDLIRALIPNPEEIENLRALSLVDAYQAFLSSGKALRNENIERLIIHDIIRLSPEDELLSAAIVMAGKNIHSLPVVDKNILIGVVARFHLCGYLVGNQVIK